MHVSSPIFHDFTTGPFTGPFAIGRWVTGYTELLNAGYALLLSMAFASAMGATGFFFTQLYFVGTVRFFYGGFERDFQGGSMYTWQKRKRVKTAVDPATEALLSQEPVDEDEEIEDRTSIRERFQSIFGDWWMLNFVVPMPWHVNRPTKHYRKVGF